jgi:aryl-alcohol dehydrogenase-like predicted oxidoreductase
MANPSRPSIERRPVPGTKRSFSAVTISVDPPAVAPPSADARAVALLRQARDRGVTTFDVADARFPERAERLIAAAFPAPDPVLEVIVGRSVESLARERLDRGRPTPVEDLGAALRESLEHSSRRLAPALVSVVEWCPETLGGSADPQASASLPPTPSGGEKILWAVRLPPTPFALPGTARSPALFAGELSLLDHEVVPWMALESGKLEARLIARDPFSDGRLDGSRFAAAATLAGPGEGPLDLRRLKSEFDPVLALGFLTKARRRTLAQAALRYVLDFPWVVTAVLPLPAPERFEEILGFAASPPLSEEERTQLGLVK